MPWRNALFFIIYFLSYFPPFSLLVALNSFAGGWAAIFESVGFFLFHECRFANPMQVSIGYQGGFFLFFIFFHVAQGTF
jgi:hypothetical protein